MPQVRTSIIIDEDLVNELKAEGEKNRRGWTVELVILAQEALAARKAKAA